jgi:hypothetical protein
MLVEAGCSLLLLGDTRSQAAASAQLGGHRIAPYTPLPSYLEDIGEIGIEVEGETDRVRLPAVIAQRDGFVACVLPEKLPAHEVQRVARKRDAAVGVYVGLVRSTLKSALSFCTVELSSIGRRPATDRRHIERWRVSP